jgi:LytTr DNA-binding domain
MSMKHPIDTPENIADRNTDRGAFGLVALVLLMSWLTLSSSAQFEAMQDGEILNWREPWFLEFTSHIVILGLVLLIPFMLTHLPLSVGNLRRRLPVYLIGFLVFTVLHILLMVGLRKLGSQALLGEPYHFGLNDPLNWIYEMRKDMFAFALFLAVFLLSRQIGQLRLEAKIAKEDARTHHRLTIKCGGRSIFLSAGEVIWAQAASNYVDIHTGRKTYLARMTLSRLKLLLVESGDGHVQTHRSYLVKRSAVREIIPSGEGDATALLTSGVKIPVSRRYRGSFKSAKKTLVPEQDV